VLQDRPCHTCQRSSRGQLPRQACSNPMPQCVEIVNDASNSRHGCVGESYMHSPVPAHGRSIGIFFMSSLSSLLLLMGLGKEEGNRAGRVHQKTIRQRSPSGCMQITDYMRIAHSDGLQMILSIVIVCNSPDFIFPITNDHAFPSVLAMSQNATSQGFNVA
jgi:hypothetical protein